MAPAEVEEPGGFLVMVRCKGLVREGCERSAQFVELRQVLNTRKDFLADWPDDRYLAVPDRFSDRCEYELLFFA